MWKEKWEKGKTLFCRAPAIVTGVGIAWPFLFLLFHFRFILHPRRTVFEWGSIRELWRSLGDYFRRQGGFSRGGVFHVFPTPFDCEKTKIAKFGYGAHRERGRVAAGGYGQAMRLASVGTRRGVFWGGSEVRATAKEIVARRGQMVFHVIASHYPIVYSAAEGGRRRFRWAKTWTVPCPGPHVETNGTRRVPDTAPVLPTAKWQGFARSVLRETMGRWKVCWPGSETLTRGFSPERSPILSFQFAGISRPAVIVGR
jgi:hypothetical protein